MPSSSDTEKSPRGILSVGGGIFTLKLAWRICFILVTLFVIVVSARAPKASIMVLLIAVLFNSVIGSFTIVDVLVVTIHTLKGANQVGSTMR